MTEYIKQIFEYFRNLALNSAGVERTLYELLEQNDISGVIELMQNHDDEVEEALKEYNPQAHDVMNRPNKSRKNAKEYETEKLPRSRQRYINEVELFFLLGSPIKWELTEGDEEAYSLFTEFLQEQRFDSLMRKAKRLAGAETESAKLYHIYRNDNTNERAVKALVLARSTGYKLRPLFDQYGNLSAFAYGYKLKEQGKTILHWDIQTADSLYYCKKGAIGWEVEQFPNPTGKINIVYYRQPKAWSGAERRLNREEMLDSKVGDTNNYFADPIAVATGDVIDSMTDPNRPGKLIQVIGHESKFEYLNPPQTSETRREEKSDLEKSILFDTFTPDLSFDNLKGLGTLSGSAIKNAMILGFIKRDNLKEIYEEMLDREKNIIIGILKYLYPNKAVAFDEMKIKHEFTEPFAVDRQSNINQIAQLYQVGLLSRESAISNIGIVGNASEEAQRIVEQSQILDNTQSVEE